MLYEGVRHEPGSVAHISSGNTPVASSHPVEKGVFQKVRSWNLTVQACGTVCPRRNPLFRRTKLPDSLSHVSGEWNEIDAMDCAVRLRDSFTGAGIRRRRALGEQG